MSNASIWKPGTTPIPQVNANATLIPQSFTATVGQTLFNITAFAYSTGVGSLLVFINGGITRAFVETSSTSFTLNTPCAGGETVLALGFVGIEASLLSLDSPFSHSTSYAVGSVGEKLHRVVDICDAPYNVKKNDSSDGQRTLNTAAINQALADAATIYIPGICRGGSDRFYINGRLNNISTNGVSRMLGEGIAASKISSNYAGEVIQIGAPHGDTNSGIIAGGAVKDMLIECTDPAGIGIRKLRCSQASFRDLYISSAASRPNTQVGIISDAGEGSSYYNDHQNINIVGFDIGYDHTDSGGLGTREEYRDCNVTTYTDNTNGIGYRFQRNNGLDSKLSGGNLEGCKKGILMATDADWNTYRTQGLTWEGMRTEGNLICDIDWGNGGYRNKFFGWSNFGNNATPGFVPMLNYDETKDNTPPNSYGTYTEKDWTPTLSAGAATFTYDGSPVIRVGKSVKIGRLVKAYFSIKATYTGGDDAAALVITGLPYPVENITQSYIPGYCSFANGLININGVYAAWNSTTIILTSDHVQLTPATYFSGSNYIQGCVEYLAAY